MWYATVALGAALAGYGAAANGPREAVSGGSVGRTVRDTAAIRLLAATFFGGSRFDHIRDVAIDPEGFVYVTGRTASRDLPVTPGAYQPAYAGGPMDAFVAKIAPDLARVVWCTYFGGSRYDVGYGIGLDAKGDVYIAGRTSSLDLATTPDALDRTYNGGVEQAPYFGGDVFVAKLSADGERLLYATYWGGSGDEGARNMAVDAAGSVYVVGRTGSTDLPVTGGSFGARPGGMGDGFVVRLSNDGARVMYATYLGGSGEERAEAVFLGPDGEAYVSGATASPDFPVTAGAAQTELAGDFDIYVVKVAPDGSGLEYATLFGGTGADAPEQASLFVDAEGRAWVAGYSRSRDFPVTPRAFQQDLSGDIDNVVLGLAPDASQAVLATYLGGSGGSSGCWETGFGAPIVAGDGSVIVAGGTACADFPVTPDGHQRAQRGGNDAFLSRVSPDASSLMYSSFLGGSGEDGARGMIVAPDGTWYVVGQTQSADFPTRGAVLADRHAGEVDAFIARFR